MRKATNYIIITILIISILSACSSKSALNQEIVDEDDVIVQVNGYNILKSSIDSVYEEYKNSGISYSEIVEDSISETLVVQKSSEYGITLTEDEINQIIIDFKSTNEDLYLDAIKQYGEEALKEKLRIRNTFSATKDYVMENIVLINGISHFDIERFAEKYNLKKQLEPYSDEQIIHDLQREIEGFLFNEWMMSLRDDAEIIYMK